MTLAQSYPQLTCANWLAHSCIQLPEAKNQINIFIAFLFHTVCTVNSKKCLH